MKNDCFACKNGKCTALTGQNCKDCKFYKTKNQHERDQSAAYMRVQSLPYPKMMDITSHYGGYVTQECGEQQ